MSFLIMRAGFMRIDIMRVRLYNVTERGLLCLSDQEKWKEKSLMTDGYLKARKVLTDTMSILTNPVKLRSLFTVKNKVR